MCITVKPTGQNAIHEDAIKAFLIKRKLAVSVAPTVEQKVLRPAAVKLVGPSDIDRKYAAKFGPHFCGGTRPNEPFKDEGCFKDWRKWINMFAKNAKRRDFRRFSKKPAHVSHRDFEWTQWS